MQDRRGRSKGDGFVQYKNREDGRTAISSLNGLEIAGQAIKVEPANPNQAGGGGMGMVEQAPLGALELDDENSGLAMTAQGRAALMAKLSRGTGSGVAGAPHMMNLGANVNPARAAMMMGHMGGQQGVMAAQKLSVPMIQPTPCVVVKNMFDPAT